MSYYYYKVLGQVNPPVSTLTTLYTVPASTNAIISTITVCNQAATSSTYSIAVRPFGVTIDPKHYINYNASIPAADTVGVTMGLTLAQTDVISVSSSNSSTSFNVFGTHITETEPVPDRTTATSVEYLVVGGGGGGGNTLGGGGGGGGVVASSAYTVTPGSPIAVTVGGGGAGGGPGINGTNSSIVGPTEYSVSLSSQYLSIPTNTALNFSTGDFTIESWIYRTSASTDCFIISASGSGGLFFGFTSAGAFGYGRAGVAWDSQTTNIMSLNKWYHVALTRSGTSIRMFINGIQFGTTQTSSQAYDLGVTSTTIGSQGANYYFNGYISNLRVVKGLGVYTGNFTPLTSPLTTTQSAGTNIAAISAASYVSLLTCQNSSFIDNSSNNLSITPTGSPTTSNIVVPFNTALGGGYGGTWQGGAGAAGGSGGGGAGTDTNPGGSGGITTQSTSSSGGFGFAGGNGIIGRLGGGGGGGGGTGYAGGSTSLSAGTGGVGYQSPISATISTYFAGGGGGGFENAYSGNTYGRGGLGGGGNGGYSSGTYNGSAGTENTGGGGGGGGNQSGSVSGLGASGGKGIVIIRFSSSMYYPATASVNATYTSANGYNIYTFLTSGTLTI